MKCIVAMFLWCCVIFILTRWDVVECGFLKKGEEMVVDIKYVKSLPEHNILNLHLTSRRYNRTSMSLSGNITLPAPFDETHQFRYKILTWGDGGWKFHGMSGTYDYACKMFQQFLPDAWDRIVHATHDPKAYNCPIQKGFYKFEDVYVDLSRSPYFFMAGKHLLKIQDIHNNRIYAACEAEFDIRFVPKVAS